eukprot:GHVU01000182.1.p2 GENE.GHVU01000182.1~~GHVU01000182.1.p2  ORF type:complete len:241 (-),score=53.25 GHVU01000182.1:12-734(-)
MTSRQQQLPVLPHDPVHRRALLCLLNDDAADELRDAAARILANPPGQQQTARCLKQPQVVLEVRLEDSPESSGYTRIFSPHNQWIIDLLKSLGSDPSLGIQGAARWDAKTRCWLLPAGHIPPLLEQLKAKHCRVVNRMHAKLDNGNMAAMLRAADCAQLTVQLLAAARLDEELPNGWRLYPHQKQAVRAILRLRRCILAFDMGPEVQSASFLSIFKGNFWKAQRCAYNHPACKNGIPSVS